MDVIFTIGRAAWVIGELGWNLISLLLRLNNAIIGFFLSSAEIVYSITIILLSKVVDFAEVLCESVYFFVDDILSFLAWLEKCVVKCWYWLRNGCGAMCIGFHEFASSTNSGLCLLLYLLYDVVAFLHATMSFLWNQVVQGLMLVGEAIRTIPKLLYLLVYVVCWTVESAVDYVVNMAYITVFESANFFKKSFDNGCRFLSDLPLNMYVGLVVVLATGTLGMKFGKKSHVVTIAKYCQRILINVGVCGATHFRTLYSGAKRLSGALLRVVQDNLQKMSPYISKTLSLLTSVFFIIISPWTAWKFLFAEDSSEESPVPEEENVCHKEESNPVIGELLEELTREREQRTCIVCQDNPRVIAFRPCGHWCVCSKCKFQIMRTGRHCPFCRTYIRSHFKVYYP